MRTSRQYLQTVVSRKIVFWLVKVAIARSNSGRRRLANGASIDGGLDK